MKTIFEFTIYEFIKQNSLTQINAAYQALFILTHILGNKHLV